MNEIVTSPQNAHLKLVRRLDRRRTRRQEGAFVVEGEDLVLAGLETGARVRVLLVNSDRVPELDPELVPCPVVHVEPRLLADVSTLGHPPRVIGIFDLPAQRTLADAMGSRSGVGPWIALDGVGDPGNVGTIVRTAAALDAGGVVVLSGTADPFGTKAARASMGACFRVPIVSVDELDQDACLFVLDTDGDTTLWDAPMRADHVIVIGGERVGISPDLRARAEVVASIPQRPEVESVNAAVAASIALYEWRRRA